MSGRTARWLGRSVVGLYFVLCVVGIVLQGLAGATIADLAIPTLLVITIAIGVWPILGAIIVSRHPNNPVGWILSLNVLPWSLDNFATGYAVFSAAGLPHSVAAEALARVWLSWNGFPLPTFGLILLILLFPNGRLAFPALRKIIWIALAGLAILLAISPFNPVRLYTGDLYSPLALTQLEWNRISPLFWLSVAIFVVAVVFAVISLVQRLRRARGDERQQLKWITYAIAFYPIWVVLAAYVMGTGSVEGVIGEIGEIGVAVGALPVLGIAFTTAIAILKYRLYDIDIIINTTLVYAALTGALAAVYFAGVLAFRGIIGQLTGQESPIAIVASTLLVAALFQPLRRRIQEFIDLRFYRHKYDAEQALAHFGSTLRDEVDSEMLTHALLAIVHDSMRPEHLSLWLRPYSRKLSESRGKVTSSIDPNRSGK